MKRKIQHNAVNNQEDEDSCTYPICFPGDAPFDGKEDKSVENATKCVNDVTDYIHSIRLTDLNRQTFMGDLNPTESEK